MFSSHEPSKPHGIADLLTVTDLSPDEIDGVIATAMKLKGAAEEFRSALAGKVMVMLFEKPSLRTRLSFEVGFTKLGGHAVYLDQQGVRMGQRESIGDCARTVERWSDVIVARTFSHETIVQLADAAPIPVINALSDRFHPCQALADALTLREFLPERRWQEISLAYVGDGNNVCHSLLLIGGLLGMRITVITPKDYQPAGGIVGQSRWLAQYSGAAICITNDPDAVGGHDVVYADTWVSMGSESEQAARETAFKPYQVTAPLLDRAGPDARFMHCLPAKRGQEVAAEVIDSPRSIVFAQAENRMHAQNALLLHMLAPPVHGASKQIRQTGHTPSPSVSITSAV